MRIMLCCGAQGLLTYDGRWQKLPCPLLSPSLAAVNNGRMIVVDTAHCLLWTSEQTHTISRGAEAVLLTPQHALVLSGETDCLMQHDLHTGQLLITSPMGVEPQGMCRIHPQLLAVCGGADGLVRFVRPLDLQVLGSIWVPGCVQRIAWSGGSIFVLSAEGGYELHTLLHVIRPDGRVQRLMQLPGIPGALCADGMGGLWAASSETLLHLNGRTRTVDRSIGGTGLIRHMACGGGCLLTCDPVLGVCRLYAPDGRVLTERHGDVGQAILLESMQHKRGTPPCSSMPLMV